MNESPEYEMRDFMDDISDDDEDDFYCKVAANLCTIKKSASNVSGTPLNIELAQLLKTDESDVGSVTFGISKNIETLERSTEDLEEYDRKKLEKAQLKNNEEYEHSSELFLRLKGDSFHLLDDKTPSCSGRTSPIEPTRTSSPITNPQSSTYHITDEQVFESDKNSYAMNYNEPNTSFHSASGYDNEQVMFEGIFLLKYMIVLMNDFNVAIFHLIFHLKIKCTFTRSPKQWWLLLLFLCLLALLLNCRSCSKVLKHYFDIILLTHRVL